MQVELKRGPSGHYTRSQWYQGQVLSGRRRDGDRAYELAPLYAEKMTLCAGFSSEHLVAEALATNMQEGVASIREWISSGLASGKNFIVGGTLAFEFEDDPATGHNKCLKIWKQGTEPRRINPDFSQDWAVGEFAEMAEDVAMEVAALDTSIDISQPTLYESLAVVFPELGPLKLKLLIDHMPENNLMQLVDSIEETTVAS